MSGKVYRVSYLKKQFSLTSYLVLCILKLTQTTYIVLNGETKIQIVIGGVSLSAQNIC